MSWSAIAAIGAIGAALAGTASGIFNYRSQLRNYAYQQWLQKVNWLREDSAAQRRAWDLRQAGLSPTLAAGSAAGAGQVVSTQAPQIDLKEDKFAQGLTMLAQIQQIEQSRQQIAQSKAQENLANIQTATKAWDLGVYKKWKQPTNTSGLSKAILEAIEMFRSGNIQNIVDKVKGEVKAGYDYLYKEPNVPVKKGSPEDYLIRKGDPRYKPYYPKKR